MTETDNIRRLARLKRRPTLADRDDDFLLLTLEESADYFLDYTHRVNDPGERIDNLVCELAVLRINQEGVENVKVAKEGEVEREWYEVVPPMLVNRLNSWRLLVGLNAEHGV